MFYVLLVFSYSSSWYNFLFSEMEHFYRKMSWLIKYSFIALWSLNWIFFHTPWHSVSFCFVWIFCLCGICNMPICYAENYRNVQELDFPNFRNNIAQWFPPFWVWSLIFNISMFLGHHIVTIVLLVTSDQKYVEKTFYWFSGTLKIKHTFTYICKVIAYM